MSVRAECWAFGARGVESAAHRAVLLGLATFADQQDRAVVSMGVLAALAVVPPPRVEQLLRDLESSGLVEQTETERPGSAAVRLLVPELLARPMALASELWAVG